MEKYACNLLLNDKRLNGRKLDEYRKVIIKPGIIDKAEGSAMVSVGKTKVLAGVKVGIGEPFSDTPKEGTLMVNAEFSPMASPDFEAGPPSEDSTELARVVDRGLRESHCVNFESLCITPGEKVLTLFVDIHIINNDGNLIDCAALASLAALKNTKLPKVEDGQILRKEVEKDLTVEHTPIEITICKVGDKFVLDPTVDEEDVVDAKVTICVREDDMICALQKQGAKEISVDDIKKMAEIAIDKSRELRKLFE